MIKSEDTYRHAILMRNAAAVKRYHTTRTLRTQTTGEHSAGVAAIIMCICPEPSANLLMAAIKHDTPELATGDLPATAKWENPQLAAQLAISEETFLRKHDIDMPLLSAEEGRMLKFADYGELVFWVLEEIALGNNFAWPMLKRGIDALKELGPINDRATNLLDYFVHASGGDLEDMVTNDGK